MRYKISEYRGSLLIENTNNQYVFLSKFFSPITKIVDINEKTIVSSVKKHLWRKSFQIETDNQKYDFVMKWGTVNLIAKTTGQTFNVDREYNFYVEGHCVSEFILKEILFKHECIVSISDDENQNAILMANCILYKDLIDTASRWVINKKVET